jgi:hypothetical protein
VVLELAIVVASCGAFGARRNQVWFLVPVPVAILLAQLASLFDFRHVAPPYWSLKSFLRLAMLKKSCDVFYLIFKKKKKPL